MTNDVVILIVEDEPLILMVIQDALEAGGYTVLTSATGAGAMELLASRIDDINGLITDIQLGGGPDGWQLGRRARELKHSMSVVYITGDSAHQWAVEGVPESIVLQKPFAEAQIVTAISSLLTAAGPESRSE